MKISAALIASVAAEWTQPSYYDFINMDTTKLGSFYLYKFYFAGVDKNEPVDR